MKSKAFGLALLMLSVLAVPAMASTQIWTNFYTESGSTLYHEYSSIAGDDWSEGAATTNPSDYVFPPVPRTTGYVEESVYNDGSVSFGKYLESPSQWVLREQKNIWASGETDVFKHVMVWTEDKKIDPSSGNLVYPTEAWVRAEFNAYPVIDNEDWYVLLDEPDAAEGTDMGDAWALFSKSWSTTNDMSLMQKVGINQYPCDLVIPEPPEPIDPHQPNPWCC